MGTLIVTYDLQKERDGWENDRNKLLAYIKANFNWARLSESSYAIDTPLAPKDVMTSLRQFLDDNDNLYVITLSRPWWGWGPKAVIDWLVGCEAWLPMITTRRPFAALKFSSSSVVSGSTRN